MSQPPRQAAIAPHLYRLLVETCASALPYEACGVLSGGVAHDRLEITGIHPVRNAALSPVNRFAFDPGDWVRVLYGMQKNRQSLVGFYHSHPSSPPVPSPADRDGLPPFGAGTSYWIVTPRHPSHGTLVQPYWLDNETFVPLMLA